MRVTGESLAFEPTFISSNEIRSDRMNADPAKNIQASAGGINFELTYPLDNTPISELLRSAMLNAWVNTPTLFNDGTAASIIASATGSTYTVTAGGAAFLAGMICRASGFADAANNQNFVVASSTGTTVVGTTLGLVTEASCAATAKLKVVGVAGASGDITATATGLGSTALNWTTLGLAVGQWIKIGATATGNRFATAADNDWARITAIAATALTLDNLPSGWTTDAGTGKTVWVWFGDEIKNGITPSTVTIERGFLGQTTPTYIVNTGMEVNDLTTTINSKANITCAATFLGMGGGESQVTLSATPDATTSGLVMSGNANVGRLGVNGSQLVGPNWAKTITVVLNNNLRAIDAVDNVSPVAVREGDCAVSGKMTTYFGNDTELAAFYAGTTRPINCRVAKNNQAILYQIPRATYTAGGNPAASAKNTDVMADFSYQASYDSVTASHIIVDRLEYFE
jgi:hypothetical protein